MYIYITCKYAYVSPHGSEQLYYSIIMNLAPGEKYEGE